MNILKNGKCYLFNDLIDHKVLVMYLDDILIHTQTWEEHVEVVVEVLLKIQPSKCMWAKTKLNFLGFIISKDGTNVDPTKILAIYNFPQPSNAKFSRSNCKVFSEY